MINLLPPQEKQDLVLQKYKRLVTVLGNMIMIILLCMTLLLVSLRFYVLAEVDAQKSNLASAENKNTANGITALKKDISTYNLLFMKLDTFYKQQVYYNEVLKNLLSLSRPAGVNFTELTISRPGQGDSGTPNAIKIHLIGFSSTRENLLKFRDNLMMSTSFKNVSFPPQSWVKDKDIEFEATFESK